MTQDHSQFSHFLENHASLGNALRRCMSAIISKTGFIILVSMAYQPFLANSRRSVTQSTLRCKWLITRCCAKQPLHANHWQTMTRCCATERRRCGGGGQLCWWHQLPGVPQRGLSSGARHGRQAVAHRHPGCILWWVKSPYLKWFHQLIFLKLFRIDSSNLPKPSLFYQSNMFNPILIYPMFLTTSTTTTQWFVKLIQVCLVQLVRVSPTYPYLIYPY